MSLATRCPACSTVFRVVQDQLKVSGGWVRCGHCHEVFNGLEALFELPPDPPAVPPPPPPSAPPPPPAARELPAPVAVAAAAGEFELDLSDPEPPAEPTLPAPAPAEVASEATAATDADSPRALPDERAEPQAPAEAAQPLPADMALAGARASAPAASLAAPQAETPPATLTEAPDMADQAAPAPSEATREMAATPAEDEAAAGPDAADPLSATAFAAWQAEVTRPAEAAEPEDHADETAPEHDAAAGHADAWPPRKQSRSRKRRRTPKPAFVRQAEQAALWRRPAMRALLGVTALALAALLGLQMLHQERDLLAARWPALQAPLRQWCELARCSLQPPRALERLALDSSALVRTPQPQVLRFEADLRNAGDHVVRAPAVELSFTDNQGRPLARKVLLPEDLAAPAEGIPSEGVWHIDAQLDTGEFRIASFTAEIFYP